MVTRLPYELTGLSRYLAQRVGGRPAWKYVDATAFSLYPRARYGGRTGVPEDTLALIGAVRKRLRAAGVPASLPIWHVYWNPFHRARVTLPAYVGHREDVLGRTGTVVGGSRLAVDFRPVLVYR